mmetsp:Transcript_25551/g.64402  ORF Transcript_25551/g.64402 Transcript_25551/m.64402 type:complete len:319 (+) Transcript_25551:208-1164(+)|eukprot:CAMPEP_0179004422 /NCGR_PEP_ID=MMETSP0795-20121207/13294_1 /TAXON_ID=88552 /ORGANISM="Amoebophrya sp., Strain Ameob2" /LENGTH=318 /DNA_ID=CAMNT_0020698679 /DNA_START=192 /DNA_END=1148 /DNA_ORIENTATION=+
MAKSKSSKSAAVETTANTSAMRTGTTTQQGKEQNQVKGAKFKTQKIAPSGVGSYVSRMVEPEPLMLEKISSIPAMCTLFLILFGPILFFGVQGQSELGLCSEKNGECVAGCEAEYAQAVSALRGAEKFRVQAAADVQLAACSAACDEVNSQCNFEALLKIVTCLGLVTILVCVGLRANVNFFVEQNIKNMERDIANEAAELTRKAQKGKSPAKGGKSGAKALVDEEAGGAGDKDDDARSHHSGSSKTGSRTGAKDSARSETKATSSAGRSEDSSALSANIIKGSGLEEMAQSNQIGRNPYLVKTFTGSRDQKTRCPYC